MTYKLMNPVLEKIEGSVICIMDGKEKKLSSAKEIMDMTFDKKYVIASISVRDGSVVISLEEDKNVPNDLSAEWAQEYIKETGKEISFF